MTANPRFLRSKSLRFELWWRAGGKCQKCGKPLPKRWHADHILAWVHGGITHIDEMQALCPKCNLEKGKRMPFKRDAGRKGQRDAWTVTEARALANEPHTTIEMCMRYGKSDLQRGVAVLGEEGGWGGLNMSLSPSEFLRDQMIEQENLEDFCKRYGVSRSFIQRSTCWTGAHEDLFAPDRLFISATIQLASRDDPDPKRSNRTTVKRLHEWSVRR